VLIRASPAVIRTLAYKNGRLPRHFSRNSQNFSLPAATVQPPCRPTISGASGKLSSATGRQRPR